MSQLIPRFSLPSEITEDTIRALFIDLQDKGLLYNVDDNPSEVITSISGERTFTDAESNALRDFWEKVDAHMCWDDVLSLLLEVDA